VSRVGGDSEVVQQQRSFLEIIGGRFGEVDAALGQVLLQEHAGNGFQGDKLQDLLGWMLCTKWA
jgi:Mn-containing catalase